MDDSLDAGSELLRGDSGSRAVDDADWFTKKGQTSTGSQRSAGNTVHRRGNRRVCPSNGPGGPTQPALLRRQFVDRSDQHRISLHVVAGVPARGAAQTVRSLDGIERYPPLERGASAVRDGYAFPRVGRNAGAVCYAN